MGTKDIQISHAFLAFKRPAESARLVLQFISEIGRLTNFQQQSLLDEVLESMQEPLSNLIGLQLVKKVDVHFEGEIFQLELHYRHEFEDHDLIDLSLLKIVPLESKQLEIFFFSEDIDTTNQRGFSDIKKLGKPVLQIALEEVKRLEQEESVEEETNSFDQNEDIFPTRAQDEDVIEFL